MNIGVDGDHHCVRCCAVWFNYPIKHPLHWQPSDTNNILSAQLSYLSSHSLLTQTNYSRSCRILLLCQTRTKFQVFNHNNNNNNNNSSSYSSSTMGIMRIIKRFDLAHVEGHCCSETRTELDCVKILDSSLESSWKNMSGWVTLYLLELTVVDWTPLDLDRDNIYLSDCSCGRILNFTMHNFRKS